MKVLVSYGRRTHEVETEPDSTVQSLKHTIGTLTTVSPNGKRLICKGRTLMDHESLAQAGLADRSKVLLMASDKASQTQVGASKGDQGFSCAEARSFGLAWSL